MRLKLLSEKLLKSVSPGTKRLFYARPTSSCQLLQQLLQEVWMTKKGAKGLAKFLLGASYVFPIISRSRSRSDTFPNAPHPLSPNGTLVHPRVKLSIAGNHVIKREGKEKGCGKTYRTWSTFTFLPPPAI